MLATVNANDLQVLWIFLAILCFGVALYLAFVRNIVGAIVAGFLGVVVVVLAIQ